MTTLLAARCQHFAAPFGLHSGAEAMGLMAPAHFGLKRAFGQRCSSERPPLTYPHAPSKGLQSRNPPRQSGKTLVYATTQHRSRQPRGVIRDPQKYPTCVGTRTSPPASQFVFSIQYRRRTVNHWVDAISLLFHPQDPLTLWGFR
jgi:hypothetical protein